MYKFTNGHIIYDKKTAEDYIKAGYKLVDEINCNKIEENDAIDKIDEAINEEDNTSIKPISAKYKKSKKSVRRN